MFTSLVDGPHQGDSRNVTYFLFFPKHGGESVNYVDIWVRENKSMWRFMCAFKMLDATFIPAQTSILVNIVLQNSKAGCTLFKFYRPGQAGCFVSG
ncbi:hypothetical protein Plhal304r1_c029g0094701 [Plasmopara halstedii]